MRGARRSKEGQACTEQRHPHERPKRERDKARRSDRGMEEVLEQEQRGRERSESGRGRAAGSEDDDADWRRGRMRLVFGMRRVESGGREREGESGGAR